MPHGRSRLTIPRIREAPPAVVAQLREIEPDAELVYMGEGRWLLGDVRPSNTRLRLGQQALRRAARAAIPPDCPAVLARWRYVALEGDLLVQGFAPVTMFAVREPDGAIVEWLRRAHYGWAAHLDALERELARADDDDIALAAEEDSAAALYDDRLLREAHRWGFRRPASVVVNGRRDAALS